MNWKIITTKDAKKQINKIPNPFRKHILETIDDLSFNPFKRDIEKIKNEKNVWRRRVGSYRIFYEIYFSERMIYIFHVKRRTTTTYCRRRQGSAERSKAGSYRKR